MKNIFKPYWPTCTYPKNINAASTNKNENNGCGTASGNIALDIFVKPIIS
jgi:hypothetical protein